MPEAAVDGLGGAARGVGVVEVGQDGGAALVQGRIGLGQFLQGLGDTGAKGVDHLARHGLASSGSLGAIGGHGLVVHAPRGLHRGVRLIGEHVFEGPVGLVAQ